MNDLAEKQQEKLKDDHKVADINLAEWGEKEIKIAETEIEGP